MRTELVEDAISAAAHLRRIGQYGASMSVCQLIDALEAAQKAVGELPEYKHGQGRRGFRCQIVDIDGNRCCTCGADEANAKRLAARKAVGLEG